MPSLPRKIKSEFHLPAKWDVEMLLKIRHSRGWDRRVVFADAVSVEAGPAGGRGRLLIRLIVVGMVWPDVR
ncbi:hypothetical protein HGA11_28055 [Mycolicibacterium septicum DSM 44393]|uniref:Uncharacterized protein n=1 Tax=Mycolicibacterium septicum DSM 44393 TaxID=1341646 RepID=A0A7X6RYR1_9MYCO|nr:hypothetical protein [Mycolicibacterium septicum]NKZ14843.1 hypothetical protein [Mycolicibacterium septicum DSM 44393]